MKIGQKFNSWTVEKTAGKFCVARCKCGNTRRVGRADLIAGRTKMCRKCSFANRVGKPNKSAFVHGLSDSPTQWVWSDMKRRCYQPRRRGYENYGGRGIKVCDRWLHGDGKKNGFSCFIEDMGVRPSKNHWIDRTNNDGDYEPGNCRWAPKSEQNYNKRNTLRFSAFGKSYTMEQAVRDYGISYGTLIQRLTTYKMDPETALTRPPRSWRQT